MLKFLGIVFAGIVFVLVLIFLFWKLLFSFCAQPKTIDRQVVQPYGLFNPEDKNENIEYKVSMGSVIVGALSFETIVVPVYIFGWNLYEPIAKK